MNKVEIPLSKKKILLLLLGAVGFVIIGVLFVVNPERYASTLLRSPELVSIVGIASILLFGALGIYGARKMFDNTVGLTIDEHGITDNSSAASLGLIKWSDIIEIRTERIASTKFLLIFTSNPNEYLDRVKGIKRKLIEGNLKMYGTPLSITSTTLDYNFEDLEKLIKERLDRKIKTSTQDYHPDR